MNTTNLNHLTAEITNFAQGIVAQANQIFGHRAHSATDLQDTIAGLAPHYAEFLGTLINKTTQDGLLDFNTELAKEVADRFNMIAGNAKNAGYMEFRQSFSVETTLYVKAKAEVTAKTSRNGFQGFSIAITFTAEVSAGGTTRSLAQATAFSNLFSQTVALATLIEGNGEFHTSF